MKGDERFADWAILELMGHRRLGGLVSDVEMFGARVLRIDVPHATAPGKFSTQFYTPASLYCLTPTTEELARAVAAANQPAPVSRWDLPAPAEEKAYTGAFGDHGRARGHDDFGERHWEEDDGEID